MEASKLEACLGCVWDMFAGEASKLFPLQGQTKWGRHLFWSGGRIKNNSPTMYFFSVVTFRFGGAGTKSGLICFKAFNDYVSDV